MVLYAGDDGDDTGFAFGEDTAHPVLVVVVDVVGKVRLKRRTPRLRLGVKVLRLHVLGFLAQMVKVEGALGAGIEETVSAEIVVLANHHLRNK